MIKDYNKYNEGDKLENYRYNVIDSNGIPYEMPQLMLPAREYSAVMSEISTNFSRFEGKKHGIIAVASQNAVYFFEIHSFQDIIIYDKYAEEEEL